MTAPIEGGMTGEHGDTQVVDDPLKPLELTGSLTLSRNTLKKVADWWMETMSTRMTSYEHSARVIIMQRLHVGDLAGIAKESGEYEVLSLPMRFEEERRCITGIGFVDPRREEGELLYPERVPESAVITLEADLGPRGAQAQLQQNPVATEGNVFKAKGIVQYKKAPRVYPMIQSWDCAFKSTDTSSYVVGQVWGVYEDNFVLIDQIRKRMSFSETQEAIRKLSIKWPKTITKLIEDKANGPAIRDTLMKEIQGIVPINPEGGKEARANAIEALWDEGKIWIPHESIAPWITEYLREMLGFPSMPYDDQVDATTQAVVYLYSKKIGKLKRAMDALSGRV
jgi:predicted phage terminase large subunit-like protein